MSCWVLCHPQHVTHSAGNSPPWDTSKGSKSLFVCLQVTPEALFWQQALHRISPFLHRLLRIWALEFRSPVAFAPMTNGLCCMYFPHGGFIATG